ncbi:hypothetical protein MPSEU_000617600 [Mayamaea pseudoterrestris]|nr:hypothetical protein MPSEU_000617600 [Mayamaea pseudoterrestris]
MPSNLSRAIDHEHEGEEGAIVIRTTEAKLREAESKLLEIQNFNEVPKSLGMMSLGACVFQFISGFILLIMTVRSEGNWNYFTMYPSAEPGVPVPSPRAIGSFNILWLSPISILLSALDHTCSLVFRSTYEWYIARNQNPFRWTEYALSASVMHLMIAQLAGITDVHLLVTIFVLKALAMNLASLHEVINAKARADGLKQNWRSFYLAWVAQLTCWIIVFNYFGVSASQTEQQTFLWVIMILCFILDNSFAVCFFLQWTRTPPCDDYATGEKMFIVLSFTAKTLLAWVAFGGVVATTN